MTTNPPTNPKAGESSGTSGGTQPARVKSYQATTFSVPSKPILPTVAKEVFNFYVNRFTDRQKDGYLSEIRALQTEADRYKHDVDHNPREFGTQGRHFIRIPALMYFSSEYSNVRNADKSLWPQVINDFRGHVAERMRRQFGNHIFINQMDKAITIIHTKYGQSPATGERPYLVSETMKQVSNAFPCCRLTNQNTTELVLGMAFVNAVDPTIHRRTYTAYRDPEQNRHVFDITPDFVADQVNRDRHYAKADMFPDNREAVAIYVCKGARLMVYDRRYQMPDEIVNTHVEKKRQKTEQAGSAPQTMAETMKKIKALTQISCRSLGQQGSLFVVRGGMQFDIGIIRNDDPQHQEGATNLDELMKNWFTPAIQQEGDQEEQKLDKLVQGEKIGLKDRKVIFIGASESQHNSVAWSLRVYDSDQWPDQKGHKGQHYCFLNVPEGGRIVDICSWNTGFRLIQRRMKYERLHTAVVDNRDPALGGEFRVPEEYYHNRILGIQHARAARFLMDGLNEKYDQLKVPRHYSTDHRPAATDDWDIRRYVVQRAAQDQDSQMTLIERPNRLINWFHRPPLYPPVFMENKFWYLFDPAFKMLKMADQDKYYIKGKQTKFVLKVKEDVDAHMWMVAQPAQINQLNQSVPDKSHYGFWQRIGLDYQVYIKWAPPIKQLDQFHPTGKMKTYYLHPSDA